MKRHDTDFTTGLVLMICFIAVLPFVGIFYMLQKDKDKQTLGLILFIVGISIWVCGAVG